ncbi:hypothetical protein HDV00_004977 [Rhizophlyctis rosea]|nr:hypothetical protein HDV00_004977 [Rhizophlyctis rosea]
MAQYQGLSPSYSAANNSYSQYQAAANAQFQAAQAAAANAQYQATPPAATMRTVYLGNLPSPVSYEEVINNVRGGALEQVKILEEKNCAFVTFVEASAAQSYNQNAQVKRLQINNQEVKIGWGKHSSIPTSVLAALQNGASRNVFIGNIDDAVTEPMLLQEFTKFGPIDRVTILSDKRIAFVHMAGVAAAIEAVSCLTHDPRWVNQHISYGEDRCARSASSDAHPFALIAASASDVAPAISTFLPNSYGAYGYSTAPGQTSMQNLDHRGQWYANMPDPPAPGTSMSSPFLPFPYPAAYGQTGTVDMNYGPPSLPTASQPPPPNTSTDGATQPSHSSNARGRKRGRSAERATDGPRFTPTEEYSDPAHFAYEHLPSASRDLADFLRARPDVSQSCIWVSTAKCYVLGDGRTVVESDNVRQILHMQCSLLQLPLPEVYRLPKRAADAWDALNGIARGERRKGLTLG